MRTRLFAALVLVLALFLGSARASPYTAYFTAVRDKAVAMRDALVLPLSKQDGKRKALLDKVIAAIDQTSTALQTDVATARTVATLLAKPLVADPEAPGLVRDLLASLAGDVRALVPTLSTRLDALPSSAAKTKAQKAFAKLQTSMTALDTAAAGSDVKALAKALAAAAKRAVALGSQLSDAEAALPIDCTGILDTGVRLVVTDKNGERIVFEQAAPVEAAATGGGTYAFVSSGSQSFDLQLDALPEDLHVGEVATTQQSYSEFVVFAFLNQWQRTPSASVQVVEERPTRVGLCIDVELPYFGKNRPSDVPAKVRVRGTMVVAITR